MILHLMGKEMVYACGSKGWDLNTTWDCFEEEFVHLAVDSVVLVEESEMRKSVCWCV